MPKTDPAGFFRKKAFELSYALFRIAAIVRSRSFADTLEEKAVGLFDSTISGNAGKTKETLNKIEYLIRFGSDTGLVHLRNAEMVIKEIGNLYSLVADFPEIPETPQKPKTEEVNLAGIFSKSIPAKRIPVKNEAAVEEAEIPAIAEDKLPEIEEENAANSAMRQSAIMQKLQEIGKFPERQTGCRFSELQELFPEISDRTIRYDLQSLANRGLIERIGSGKKGFYRLKNQRTEVIELPGISS